MGRVSPDGDGGGPAVDQGIAITAAAEAPPIGAINAVAPLAVATIVSAAIAPAVTDTNPAAVTPAVAANLAVVAPAVAANPAVIAPAVRRGGGRAFNNRRAANGAIPTGVLAHRNQAAFAAASNTETINYNADEMGRRARNADPIDGLDNANQTMTIGIRAVTGLVSAIRSEREHSRANKDASNLNGQIMNLLNMRAQLFAQGMPTQGTDILLAALQARQAQMLLNMIGGAEEAIAPGVDGAVGAAENESEDDA